MTLLDFILIGVMLLSAFLAMVRGMTREVLSIASWVLASIAALFFFKPLTPIVQPHVGSEVVAAGVAAFGVFIVTLIVVSYITARISDFVLDSQAGPLDRSLGFAFGAARGFLLVVIAFMFFNWLVPEKQQPEWIANAKSKSWLEGSAATILSFLPQDPDTTIIDKARSLAKDKPAAEPSAKQESAAPQTITPPPPTGYDKQERKELKDLIEKKANPQ